MALDYFKAFITTVIKKIPGRAEADRTNSFPFETLEEALVNAVYHRSYNHTQEPVKIFLYSNHVEIISYAGPVPGLKPDHFKPGVQFPPVPNRNRRIGEFLKELNLVEGRYTGIPKIHRKMKENGSPEPTFDFDEDRTYFRVTLQAKVTADH